MSCSHGKQKIVHFDKPGHSDVLKVDEIAVPHPGNGQVLVRVHAAGLNKIEVFIREGMIPLPPGAILGTDGAGVVEEVGNGSTHFKKGDRVAIFGKHPSPQGTYAQYFVAEPDMLFNLPDKYSFEEGASLGIPFMTAYYNIVIHGEAKAGDVVLVNGASGAVGLYAVEIAKSLGCKVIGVAGHDKGLALITGKGAIAISYKDADYVKKVKDAAGPRGVNLILETTSKNLPKDIDVLGGQGKVILIGDAAKETLDLQAVLQKELTIKATQAFSATPEQYKLMRAGLEKALKDGSIKPVVEKVYPINQIAQAHDDLVSNRSTAGKLVLNLS